MNLPSEREICPVPEDLDGQCAVRNFLGKSIEEAEALFRENSLHYQEDLMWMGPVAFRFYFPATERYVRSEHSRGDSDIINCLAGLLQFKLEWSPDDMRPIAGTLATFCDYVAAAYDRFDVIEDIYGDARGRYSTLKEHFEQMQE